MIKIMFVCYGNISRSPMAEFVFKDMVNKKGWNDDFFITSSATSDKEIGNDISDNAKGKLDEKGIPYERRKARRLTLEDYEKYDFIIGMEESNIKNIKNIVGEDKQNKIHRLLDFSNNPRDIADPWHTGNFEAAYNEIVEGCNSLIMYLEDFLTIKYYNDNYNKYSNDINYFGEKEFYVTFGEFLKKVREKGRILDAGCGTGRDSKLMLNLGFDVVAFDASSSMVKLAQENTGLPVKLATFQNVDFREEYFDGILAAASLLHVAKNEMNIVYDKMYKFLKDDGFFFVSYKINENDYADEFGRRYSCYTEQSFRDFIKSTKFKIDKISIRDGGDVKWLNCILKK